MNMLPESLLSGGNAAWLDAQYRVWLDDPSLVDTSLALAFAALDPVEVTNGHQPGDGPSYLPGSIFNPAGLTGSNALSTAAAERQARVAQLINAYRVRGHMLATIDPLGRREAETHPELDLKYFGLTPADMDVEVPTAPLHGMPPRATLREVFAHLKATYCLSVGAEFMNIQDNVQKHWVQEQLETLPNRGVLSPTEEARVYRKLADAENFERMLHTRFPGTKRFSLEGGETLIPLLDLVIKHAGQRGVREIVFGMAHRGRLNCLVNTLEKPAKLVVAEFQDVGGSAEGSGDVKYHLGYSADTVTVAGDEVHLSLTPNPSHLEAVDPVVQGRVRAKQDRAGDVERRSCMPLLLHGDAAFSGQGLVMEVLNLSELSGYRTGGTVHVIVNNQIGFTTPPSESRSTPYATDIARMLAIPIFHVNGEDPRAVAAVAQMAVEWRQRFGRDVVIDMYCYRKHGHNEGDEPSFTQPLMYEAIRAKPTPRAVYGKHLMRIGALTESDLAAIDEASRRHMSEAIEVQEAQAVTTRDDGYEGKGEDPDMDAYFATDEVPVNAGERTAKDAISPLKGLWQRFSGGSLRDTVDTGFDRARLIELLHLANTLPDGFTPHRKIARLFKQRRQIIDGDGPLDWAMGEQAAWSTLLDQGHPVRISGQDCGRGTFSHRHATVTNIVTGQDFQPLSQIGGRFDAVDSSLSESGVLGFEVGFALDTPDGLVMWEAQFGDFANGAQIIIDQFLTASEQKWGRYLGIVLMLPHGYEGQGPEHSSARIERFLLQCAQDNIQVCNVTNPAQLFHVMRRQLIRQVRAPLILFTPKSLLRHADATSRISDLCEGRFHDVLDDPEVTEGAKRVVLCSGKLYYELLIQRRELGQKQVALVRVEQLYPWPHKAIESVLAKHTGAEVIWCQEEPKNMGPWPVIFHFMAEHMPFESIPRYVGRRAAAAPATGSNIKHRQEQAALIRTALTL
jgi:2-oxoglutarate dehydrogenase E1 component